MDNINEKDLEKVSGGMSEAHIKGGQTAIWSPQCPKCGKKMPGGIGVKRVDGTIYEHPYFCETCANSLTCEEKNINPTPTSEAKNKI